MLSVWRNDLWSAWAAFLEQFGGSNDLAITYNLEALMFLCPSFMQAFMNNLLTVMETQLMPLQEWSQVGYSQEWSTVLLRAQSLLLR